MEDPFYRTLNRVRVLEDDLRVEVDRKIKLESRSNVIAYELVSIITDHHHNIRWPPAGLAQS